MSEIPRVFVKEEEINLSNNFINLQDKEEIHYLKNVHRLKRNAAVIALDNNNNLFYGTIESLTNNQAQIKINHLDTLPPYPITNITAIQALIKGEKQDFAIQKATELGVNIIITVNTDHTDFKLNEPNLIQKKLQRWQKIAKQATKQSKRGSIPEIYFEENLPELLAKHQSLKPNVPIVACSEKAQELNLKQALKKLHRPITNIVLLIGPEGGWSEEELNLFTKLKIPQITLGKNILRVETALILAIGYLLYELELT